LAHGAQHDRADGRVGVDRVAHGDEFLDHGHGERIAAVRCVQGDHADRPQPLESDFSHPASMDAQAANALTNSGK
jgi:hypothetical protein